MKTENSNQIYICRVCNSKKNKSLLKLREMMFGFRKEFEYFQCPDCRCIQIKEIPPDIEKYYPSKSYYSLQQKRNLDIKFFENAFAKASFKQRGLLYQLSKKAGKIDRAIAAIGKMDIQEDANILDVGSGSGDLLEKLNKLGFQNLIGVDPFLIGSQLNKKRKILNEELRNLDENLKFDLVMFHHSLEHMQDPLMELKTAKDHLEKDGTIIVRIPIIGYAYEKFGINWYSMDPPRHFYLNSFESAKIIIENAGLEISNFYFDSGPEQFILSEAYASDIAMEELPKRGYYRKIIKDFFSKDFQRYLSISDELNKKFKGDQVVFYLKKNE